MSFGTRALRPSLAMLTIGVSIASLVPIAATSEAGQTEQERPKPPNILIFIGDDQRARGTMEVMDATRRFFIEGGVRFPNGFATSPLCCPSRASIFTGQYAHNHGVLTNSESDLPQEETIQRYLDEAGYRTAIFGKYLNSWDLDVDPPHFDKWAIFKSSQQSYDGSFWNVQSHKKIPKGYPTRVIGRKADNFLGGFAEKKDGRPWALIVAAPAPHLPAKPQERYEEARVGGIQPNPATKEDDRRDKPPHVRRKRASFRLAEDVAERQRRTLLSTDDLVERVMERLQVLDERKNTLAFYLSDNGFSWGEHKLVGSKASKQNPYTDAIRIPYFVRWPKEMRPGAVEGRFVTTVDVAPTIMDAAGLDRGSLPPMDGRSLLNKWRRGQAFFEFFTYPRTRVPSWGSIRTRDYQYAEYYDENGSVDFREYYNLERDPWQLVNLFKDGKPGNDPNGRKLSARVDALRSCIGSECP